MLLDMINIKELHSGNIILIKTTIYYYYVKISTIYLIFITVSRFVKYNLKNIITITVPIFDDFSLKIIFFL